MTDYNTPESSKYRVLNAEEVALFDALNALGEECAKAVARVKALADADGRWAAIGKTDLQTGIMALKRAVARPGGF